MYGEGECASRVGLGGEVKVEGEGEGEEGGGKAIPPRPPPNANAVIHLPVPSSPPFNNSRMSSLMAVLEFIKKWLRPPATRVPLTRPLKILIYSNDGYTESSGAAPSLLMKLKGLKLPEAYTNLQVTKRRSFFVYGDDLGVLRKVEQRIAEEHERERRRDE